ncbi:MAG: sigma-70 family RNA polymerase sigma factor [Rikenellaceae bacterium]
MDNVNEFEKLIKEHKGTIYSICYMYAPSPSDVDDYAQEVLINLWKGFGDFRGENSVKTWLWRISFNTCITFMRKRKRSVKAISISESISQITPDIQDQKQFEALYQRISCLDRLEKAIILLWLESMSYDEIAQIMGLTVPTVATRLVRIKEKLKQMSNH